MKNVLILLVCSSFLSACLEEDKWTAFVYPDINNLPYSDDAQNYTIGEYGSFEECQKAAVDRVNKNLHDTGKQGDYQCGLNCTQREEYKGLLVCDEDRK